MAGDAAEAQPRPQPESGQPHDNALLAAAKLRLSLRAALSEGSVDTAARDTDGRMALHFAAGYGNEEAVEALLAAGAPPAAVDTHGDAPLHLAAAHGHPMSAFSVAKAAPSAVMLTNSRGQTPVDVAALCQHHEVLNAMLLGCAGETGPTAVQALNAALAGGAVPDTWAPNGSSALMLAAAANSGPGCEALLGGAATLELADALGRTALMFAAGNDACVALASLLDAGASVAARDKRGRCVSEYAPPGSKAAEVLAAHLAVLQAASDASQAELLASLEAEDEQSAKKSGSAAVKAARKKAKKARRAAGLPPSVPEGGPAESDAHPAAAQSEPASAPDDAGTHPAAEPAASGANGITAFEEPQHPDNRCSRLPGAGVAADHCKRIERQPRQPDSQPQASAAGQTAEQRAPHSRNLQPAAGSSVAQQNSNKDARPAGSGPSACLPSTDGIVPTATKLNDWLPTQQEPEEPWHTVPTGRKGRKEPRERLPGEEAAPLEHRLRTPSCASLNSSCSTASREIEIISGGRRMGSSVSLQQLGSRSRAPAAGGQGASSRSLSCQGSDDGTSVDGSEQSSCTGRNGRRSVELHAPSPALAIDRSRTPHGAAHPLAAGSIPAAPAAGASPAAAPATPTAAEGAATNMTWAARLARSTVAQHSGGGGSGRASPAGGHIDASTPPPCSTSGNGGTGAPVVVAAPVTPRTAESPHGTASTPPDVPSTQQQQHASVRNSSAAAPPSAFAAAVQPPQQQPLAPASWKAFDVAAGRTAVSDSSPSRQRPCAECTSSRSDLTAAVHAATVLHERMTGLERQVAELQAAAAAAERSHRAQLDAVLQDAAAHEAAAVSAAVAVTAAHLTRGSAPGQPAPGMSRHAKAALAALAPLTPEQITLLQHPSMGAAILQGGRQPPNGALRNGTLQQSSGCGVSNSSLHAAASAAGWRTSGASAQWQGKERSVPPSPGSSPLANAAPFSLFGGASSSNDSTPRHGGGGLGGVAALATGLLSQASAPSAFPQTIGQAAGSDHAAEAAHSPADFSPVRGGSIPPIGHRRFEAALARSGFERQCSGDMCSAATAGCTGSSSAALDEGRHLLHGFGGVIGGRDDAFGRASSFGFPTSAVAAPTLGQPQRQQQQQLSSGSLGACDVLPGTPALGVNGWRRVDRPGSGAWGQDSRTPYKGGTAAGVDWSLAATAVPGGQVESHVLVGSL